VTIDSTSYNLVFYLGNQSSSSYAVMLSGTNLNASSIQIDNITDEIVISTSRYINSHLVSEIRCIYDSQNHALTDIYIDGDISSFVSNNGNITATIPQTNSSCFFADCDGTTSELQTLFKRRYMKDYSWQVDNSNSDRFVSDTTNYFSGTGAVKRRGYSGGAVSLNLNSDFASPKAVKQLQFWVYNPSSSDITMRSWVYRASNFGENSELATSVAEANSWTFVTLAINNLSVYNFQIADFTNSGVNLTFDNIYLF